MEANSFSRPFLTLLEDALGVSAAPSGYLLDTGHAGLLGTDDALPAAAASASRGPDEPSIAAHCGHILHLLDFFSAHERGETPAPDWAGRWAVQTVDAAAWTALRAALRAAYQDLVTRLQSRRPWPEQAVGPAMLLLTHCAYHVGEIRQRLSWVQPGLKE